LVSLRAELVVPAVEYVVYGTAYTVALVEWLQFLVHIARMHFVDLVADGAALLEWQKQCDALLVQFSLTMVVDWYPQFISKIMVGIIDLKLMKLALTEVPDEGFNDVAGWLTIVTDINSGSKSTRLSIYLVLLQKWYFKRPLSLYGDIIIEISGGHPERAQ
jgi:hypothetical protein